MWEHVSLTFRRQDVNSGRWKPFRTEGPLQMDAIRELSHLGFECVGVTTLADGSLYLMFKRPVMDDNQAVEIDEREGMSIGLYL
jgi:hypothetical protein